MKAVNNPMPIIFCVRYVFKTKKGENNMATFFMFGKYSSGAMKDMSAKRTEKIINLIKKFDGEINSMYALLGEQDLVFIVNFPGTEQAMKASVALSKLTDISFATSQAVTVEDFDRILSEI